MTPVMGFHSVMLSPDSVRRVTPPTTMIARTSVAEAISHPPTAGGERIGRGASEADAGIAPVARSVFGVVWRRA